MVVSTTVGVAYLAIFLTIVRRVLLHGDQWRTNPLATATACIFFSCGIGHGLHAVHLLELGRSAPELYDSHMTVWDVGTAFVAVWYWSIRGRLDALRGSGVLFQDERQAEQQRLAGLLDELFDGVVVLDLAEAVEAGDVEERLRASAELAPLLAGLHAVDAEDAVGQLASLARAGRTGPRRTSLGDALGDSRTYDVAAVPWPQDGVVLAWRDTTAATALAREKRASEAHLAAAFGAAPVAMAVVDPAGVDRGNTAFARLVGEAGERSWHQLFDEADSTEATDRLQAALRGQTLPPWDARVLSTSDGTRWVNVSLAPVHGPDGGVGHVVAHLIDIEDRKRYEARLRHVAEHDPLTGLANRRRFERELRRHCDVVQRYGRDGCVLMLDLDHFKEVNDTLGHAVGDQLLVSVAQLLSAHTRESDLVARLGGDEFAVLMPYADRAEGEQVAARICEVVRGRSRGLGPVDPVQRVTVSVGLAFFDDVEPTPEAMLMAADLTLYDAKEAGRDTWSSYSDGQHSQPRSKSRLEWLDRLRTALEQQALVVVAQPLLDLRTGATDHAELLLRLRGEDGELVAPARFLYMAETSDLICDVDRWMLAFALEHLRRHPGTALSVNVSGRSLSDRQVTDELEALVRSAALAPGRLVIEITETAAVANLHEAQLGLARLQDAGCRIALDDFGAGFGSLAYVKHLPFDLLKIDGQFVEGCLDDPVDMTVIDAVVSLARGLGKEVVAEHVTDARMLAVLREHGVDYAQGYEVGRPTVVEVAVPGARTGRHEAVVVVR